MNSVLVLFIEEARALEPDMGRFFAHRHGRRRGHEIL